MKTFLLSIAVTLLLAYSAFAGCGVGYGGYGGFSRGYVGYGGYGYARPITYHRPVYRAPTVFYGGYGVSSRQALLLRAERLGRASRFESRFINGLSLSDEYELLRRLRLY